MTIIEVLVDEAGWPRTVGRALRDIVSALTDWRDVARKNRIAEREIAMMADAIGPRLEAVASAA